MTATIPYQPVPTAPVDSFVPPALPAPDRDATLRAILAELRGIRADLRAIQERRSA